MALELYSNLRALGIYHDSGMRLNNANHLTLEDILCFLDTENTLCRLCKNINFDTHPALLQHLHAHVENEPGSSTPGNDVFQFKASKSWVAKFCVRNKIPAAKKASVAPGVGQDHVQLYQGAAAELDLDSIKQQVYNLPCTPDRNCGCKIHFKIPDFVEAFFINHPDGQNVITFDPDTEGWFIH